ncbi:MAG TPA: lysophospholipid acyltransferase family protein [Candidatus Xenobia bacterium]|jgi:1-acyl-sn-glycerol-3-phosphate acyltransferase
MNPVYRVPGPRYTGPRDGKSHPAHPTFIRQGNRALLGLFYRTRVEGADKMPLTGPQVYCFNHPTIVDPSVTIEVVPRDVRYLAAEEVFTGAMGRLMTWAGAFPVNRKACSQVTVQHAEDVLRQGLGVGIAPEGGCSDDPLRINAFKRGPALIALKGGAESLVPITMHYRPDDGLVKHRGEQIAGWLGAAAVTAGALATGAVGAVAGAVLAGTCAGGWVGKQFERIKDAFDPISPMVLHRGVGALTGAVLATAAVLGTTILVPALAIPVAATAAVAGGLGVLGLARAWRKRPIADVVIDDPIPVPRITADQLRETINGLTTQLHAVMGRSKARLTGVSFDENSPAIKGG